MKAIASTRADNGSAVIDPWSAVHFGSGLAVGLASLSFTQTIAIMVLSELSKRLVVERIHKEEEEIHNQISDALLFVVGWKAGRMWNDT